MVSRGGIEPPTRRLRVADGRSDLRRNRATLMSESAADGVSRQIAAAQTHPALPRRIYRVSVNTRRLLVTYRTWNSVEVPVIRSRWPVIHRRCLADQLTTSYRRARARWLHTLGRTLGALLNKRSPSYLPQACPYQFSVGRSARSTMRTSTCCLPDSSLKPSCSRKAVNIDAASGSDGGGGAPEEATGTSGAQSIWNSSPSNKVRPVRDHTLIGNDVR